MPVQPSGLGEGAPQVFPLQMLGNDGHPLADAVSRYVGVGGCRGVVQPSLGACVLGAERDNIAVWLVIDVIG
jgi:hypothetical protein